MWGSMCLSVLMVLIYSVVHGDRVCVQPSVTVSVCKLAVDFVRRSIGTTEISRAKSYDFEKRRKWCE